MERQNISQTNWSKVKGEIQKTWSGLNASELESTHGDVKQITELVQKKYGLRREDVEKRLDEVIGGRTEKGASQGSSMDSSTRSSSLNSGSSKSAGSSSNSSREDLPRHRDMGSSSSASSRGDWEEGSPRQDFSKDRRENRDSFKENRDSKSGSGRTFSGQRDEAGRSGFNPQVNRNDQSRRNSDSSEKRH